MEVNPHGFGYPSGLASAHRHREVKHQSPPPSHLDPSFTSATPYPPSTIAPMAPSPSPSNTFSSAPLPSPSTSTTASSTSSSSYFPFPSQHRHRTSMNPQASLQTQQQTPSSTSHPSQAQPSSSHQQPLQQPLPQPHQQNPFPPARGLSESRRDELPATESFCLVAEAAKRAQMAVLMRDLGECAL